MSIFCAYFADKRRQNDKEFWLLVSVIIFIGSFFAGARNNNIGTDIYFYAHKVFFIDVKWDIMDAEIDPMIVILAKISRLFSDKFGFFLFLIEAWIIGFSLYAAALLRDRMSFTLFVALFCLIEYNQSLNIMRQGMASSCLLCMVAFMIREKYLGMLVSMVLAYYCHSTSILGLLLMALYLLSRKYSINKLVCLVVLVSTTIILVFNTLYTQTLSFLMGSGIVSDVYERYLGNKAGGLSNTTIAIAMMYFIIVAIILIKSKSRVNLLTFFCVSLALALTFCSAGGEVVGRISQYFCFFQILLLPLSLYKEERIYSWLVVAISLLSFIIRIWIFDYNETNPYQSNYLNI